MAVMEVNFSMKVMVVMVVMGACLLVMVVSLSVKVVSQFQHISCRSLSL